MIKLLPFILFGLVYTQFPLEYNLFKSSDQLKRYEHNSNKGQIASNMVIDIKSINDSLVLESVATKHPPPL